MTYVDPCHQTNDSQDGVASRRMSNYHHMLDTGGGACCYNRDIPRAGSVLGETQLGNVGLNGHAFMRQIGLFGCLGCLLIPFAVILFLILLSGDDSNPPRPVPKPSRSDPDDGVRGAGWQSAKKLITPALKVPATADFPWETVSFSRMKRVTDKSGATAQRWRVRGAVDAQNSFGAQIRSQWEVIILARNDTFFPVEARLDGEVVFQMDSYKAMSE